MTFFNLDMHNFASSVIELFAEIFLVSKRLWQIIY